MAANDVSPPAVPKPPLRVAIIGAGITGLLIAQGLQKVRNTRDCDLAPPVPSSTPNHDPNALTQLGITATVFDADASLSCPREWTMTAHWAVPMLTSLLPASVSERLRSAYCDPTYPYAKEVETVPFFNGLTGGPLFTVPAPPGYPMRRFSRARLRGLAAEGLAADVRWGMRLVDVEVLRGAGGEEGEGGEAAPVTAVFADGTRFGADVVVGTDGPRSSVREAAFALSGDAGVAQAVATDLAIASCVVRYGDAATARFVRSHDPVQAVCFHPGGGLFVGIQDVPDPEDPATWSFHLGRSWSGATAERMHPGPGSREDGFATPEKALATVKDITADWPDPFRTAVLAIPDGTRIWTSRARQWAPVPWDNHGGRLTLAGDAAHPMMPCECSFFIFAGF